MNIKIKADKNGVARFYAMNQRTFKFRQIDSHYAFSAIEKNNANVIDETPDNQANAGWK